MTARLAPWPPHGRRQSPVNNAGCEFTAKQLREPLSCLTRFTVAAVSVRHWDEATPSLNSHLKTSIMPASQEQTCGHLVNYAPQLGRTPGAPQSERLEWRRKLKMHKAGNRDAGSKTFAITSRTSLSCSMLPMIMLAA